MGLLSVHECLDLGWELAVLCSKPVLDTLFSLLQLTPISTACDRNIVVEILAKHAYDGIFHFTQPHLNSPIETSKEETSFTKVGPLKGCLRRLRLRSEITASESFITNFHLISLQVLGEDNVGPGICAIFSFFQVLLIK